MAQSKNKKGDQYRSGEDNKFNEIKDVVTDYATRPNVWKGVGIAAGIGVLAFVAYKYIPFEKIWSNLEEAYDDNFGEDQSVNRQELANVEE